MYHRLLIWLVYCVLGANTCGDCPILTLNQGVVQGRTMNSANGKRFSAFTGIPYAKPPVGQLRFEAPLPIDPWKGVLNATGLHNICIQPKQLLESFELTQSEDCLYLNVYTPKTNFKKPETYSVMVYIHGGGFDSGSGQLHGPHYLLDYDIVYVSINYRLGFLGFFTTGDKLVPGNNGLKDQLLAIKWVNDNIKFFGGDPKRITLFGQSAGAASVHLHQLSQLSKGLFQYAISQSGTAINKWSVGNRKTVADNGKVVATIVNCPTENSYVMVKCLKKILPENFDNVDKRSMNILDITMPFRPIVEIRHKGAFLDKHPIDIIRTGKFNQVPWVTGITTDESGLIVASIFKNPENIIELNSNLDEYLSLSLKVYNKTAIDAIRKFYFENKKLDNSTQFRLVDYISDILFTFAAKKAALLHSKYTNQPVYFYLFGHKSQNNFGQLQPDNNSDYGTSHSDETILQFSMDALFGGDKRCNLDKVASNLINTLWTDFSKYGNPTPATNIVVETKWERVKTNNLEYAFIERNINNCNNMLFSRMKFWESFHESQLDITL